MQELLVQEQIELELHEYLLVQMTLLLCHVAKDKLPNLQPD